MKALDFKMEMPVRISGHLSGLTTDLLRRRLWATNRQAGKRGILTAVYTNDVWGVTHTDGHEALYLCTEVHPAQGNPLVDSVLEDN